MGKEKYMIQKEQDFEAGEIFFPEAEEEEQHSDLYEEFVMVPACKYEMMIRESEKLASVGRYLDTEEPTLDGVKVMMEVV